MKKYSFRRAASLLVAAALALGLAGCGKSPQPADSSASSQAVQSTPPVQPQAAGEEPGLEIGAQTEAHDRDVEIIDNGTELVDLRFR